MIVNLPTYDEARKAIRDGKDPMAFLQLGILYAQGVGTLPNHVLANYFFDKAARMGCEEAYQYIVREYESGLRDLKGNIEKELDDSGTLSPDTKNRLGKIIDGIRAKKYYGLLSEIRKYIPLFYPGYSPQKAIKDILNDDDSVDADIFYSMCTSDNQSEMDLESQELFLQQLHAPLTKNVDLLKRIKRSGNTDVLGKEASELLQAAMNLAQSYAMICRTYRIKKKENMSIAPKQLFPYVQVPSLVLLRRQAVRCLLSIRDTDPLVEEFLNCLDSDEQLLNICERVGDRDLQLFLMTYVELNLDIDSLETIYLNMLVSYRRKQTAPTVTYLNELVQRLTDAGIKHQLPLFTSANLPPIDLYASSQDPSFWTWLRM